MTTEGGQLWRIDLPKQPAFAALLRQQPYTVYVDEENGYALVERQLWGAVPFRTYRLIGDATAQAIIPPPF